MNGLVRILVASAWVMLSNAASAQDQDYLGGYDGRWEGQLKSIAPQSYDAVHGINLADDWMLAFVVKNEGISVYTGDAKGNWREAKAGHFQILSFKTNAAITAIDSSNEAPNKEGWVETWNFSATHTDRDHLLVAFTRMVSNYTKADENHTATPGRFVALGFGELHRVGP